MVAGKGPAPPGAGRLRQTLGGCTGARHLAPASAPATPAASQGPAATASRNACHAAATCVRSVRRLPMARRSW